MIGDHSSGKTEPEILPCQRLPGAEDLAVVMRTGATEIKDKLPIHFNTTFRCYQDPIILSDYAETFQGHEVHDVFASMDLMLKMTHPDFALYTRLLQHGREGLSDAELSGKASFEGSKMGKGDNPGWKVDKWKFLPMMNETLKLRPDKKWYLFVEPDSYPVYSNMLQWLERLDSSKPQYYGSEVQIGPDIFAHGGSTFIMSRPAVEHAANIYAERRQEWDEFTGRHWAGDCVLGKALREAGTPLQFSWPMFQGGHPEKMDFTEKKGNTKLWCAPALSYHHFSPVELPRTWEFEQTWVQSRLDKVSNEMSHEKRWSFWEDYSDILEHRDVFREFVWPRIRLGQPGSWNNLSPQVIDDTAGGDESYCRHICEEKADCLQYSFGRDGCSISTRGVMLGVKEDGFKSGWMLDRVERWMDDLDDCVNHEGWTVP